jgi:hypothetical protein
VAIREAPDYHWYQIVKGPDYTQGDIFRDCPIPVPSPDQAFFEAVTARDREPQARVGIKVGNVVVLTQACDIAQNKVDSIVLCPVFSLKQAAEQRAELGTEKGQEKLRSGNYFFLHLINKDADLTLDYGVVDFRELYTLPSDFLRLVAERSGDRPRLLPPYREQLSQAFARYFMRVGLPIDIKFS